MGLQGWSLESVGSNTATYELGLVHLKPGPDSLVHPGDLGERPHQPPIHMTETRRPGRDPEAPPLGDQQNKPPNRCLVWGFSPLSAWPRAGRCLLLCCVVDESSAEGHQISLHQGCRGPVYSLLLYDVGYGTASVGPPPTRTTEEEAEVRAAE